MQHIGEISTFYSLLKRHIRIPALQRDYIYGYGDKKVRTVLSSMLQSFRSAVFDRQTCTLQFIYGHTSDTGEFLPLDGQQRLTTLFLLHYYAALCNVEGMPHELRGFSYATRTTTIDFTNKVLLNHFQQIRNAIKDDCDVRETILNLPDYREGFNIDPSVVSMVNVLGEIQKFFKHDECTDLWGILTSQDAPINFYILDFGRFAMSDNLYTKMNARGKPLTDFEIFKSEFHKRLLKIDDALLKPSTEAWTEKLIADIDTKWMNAIWRLIRNVDQDAKLEDCDRAFMTLLAAAVNNILRFLNNGLKSDPYAYIAQDEGELVSLKLHDSWVNHHLLPWIKNIFDIFSDDILRKALNMHESPVASMLNRHRSRTLTLLSHFVDDPSIRSSLYIAAYYFGLLFMLSDRDLMLRLQHIHNLIRNSDDKIRQEFFHDLLRDTWNVMKGGIQNAKRNSFNEKSWNEEIVKDRHSERWIELMEFEEIDEINGTISAFTLNLPDGNLSAALQDSHLSDSEIFRKLKSRLGKARCFFEFTASDGKSDEPLRRNILFSKGDFSVLRTNRDVHFIGNQKRSWLNFTGFHNFEAPSKLMAIFDTLPENRVSLRAMSSDLPEAENWRYYMMKYSRHLDVCYNHPDYGYLYFYDLNQDDIRDTVIDLEDFMTIQDNRLDFCVLQSTEHYSMNIFWKSLNKILKDILDYDAAEWNVDLVRNGAARIKIMPGDIRDMSLDIGPDGWHVYNVEETLLAEAGIGFTPVTPKNEEVQPYLLLRHQKGMDYAEEGKEFLEMLSSVLPGLK